jgi:DNA-binding transcriptional ArsR family regulator
MKDPLQSNRCARKLAALAAPERLRIVDYLREGPRTVGEIAQMLKEPMVNASHHLMVLRHAKLVRCERKGRYMLYSLSPAVFRPDEDPTSSNHLNLGCCRIEIPNTDGN